MRAAIHQVQKKNYTWIFALILLIVPLVIEFIWGEDLYNITHDDIEKAQKFMYDTTNLKVFDNSEDTLNSNTSDKNDSMHNKTLLNYLTSFLDESSDKSNSVTNDIFFTEFIIIFFCILFRFFE